MNKKVKYAYQELPEDIQKTQPPRTGKKRRKRERKREWLIETDTTINKRTRGVTALERSVAKQFATGGLNQVLGCTNLTLAPTGSHINRTICHWGFKSGSRVHQPHNFPNRFSYEQTSTSCLGKITPTHTNKANNSEKENTVNYLKLKVCTSAGLSHRIVSISIYIVTYIVVTYMSRSF